MPVDLQAQILVLRTSVDASLGARRDPSATGLGEKLAEGVQLPWRSGERLSGTVETVLSNGRFHVRVGDFVFNVALPQKLPVGERLELEFVSAAPRPSFALIQAPEAQPRAAPQAADISPSARALTSLIQSLAPDKPIQPLPVGASSPLLPGPPVDAAPLAAALQQALGRSGLFYESHLAQWAAGTASVGGPAARAAGTPVSPHTPWPPRVAAGGWRARPPGLAVTFGGQAGRVWPRDDHGTPRLHRAGAPANNIAGA